MTFIVRKITPEELREYVDFYADLTCAVIQLHGQAFGLYLDGVGLAGVLTFYQEDGVTYLKGIQVRKDCRYSKKVVKVGTSLMSEALKILISEGQTKFSINVASSMVEKIINDLPMEIRNIVTPIFLEKKDMDHYLDLN